MYISAFYLNKNYRYANLRRMISLKDDKGWFLKAEADSSATGLGMEIDKELLKEMPFLNITFKIEKDFDSIDQKTKDGHDWAARVMVGHGKKIGSKLISLAHSSFLEEGFLQTSPWTKGSRDYVIFKRFYFNAHYSLLK